MNEVTVVTETEVSLTTLIHRMREELVRRNYAATTIHSYLKAVEHFSQHIRTPLDQLGPDDIRSYHAYLLEHRKLAPPSSPWIPRSLIHSYSFIPFWR